MSDQREVKGTEAKAPEKPKQQDQKQLENVKCFNL